MRIWAFIAASLCLAVQAGWEDQYSGLWFDPSNPGWGVSLHQQGQSINATLLLYGKDGDARYFEARDARLQDWDPYVLWDPVTFGGTLREPGLPSSRAVGTIVLSFEEDLRHGTLTHVIDGVRTTSPVTRATFENTALAGAFAGNRIATSYHQCAAPFANEPVRLSIEQSGQDVVLRMSDDRASCEITGTYRSLGPTGTIDGTAQCSGPGVPVTGTFAASDTRVERESIGFHYSIWNDDCRQEGRLAIARTGSRLADESPPHDDVSSVWTKRNLGSGGSDAGWSIAVHQQGNTLFAMVLVPGEHGGSWYVASNMTYTLGQDGDFTEYDGELWATEGPPYTGAFDYRRVRTRRVGLLQITVDRGGYSNAIFDIDNVRRSGPIEPWLQPRDTRIAGSWTGIRTDLLTAAPTAAPGEWTITQDSSGLRMSLIEAARTCEIAGALQWRGLTGEITGLGNCRDSTGAVRYDDFYAQQVRMTDQGLTMRYWFLGSYGGMAAVARY